MRSRCASHIQVMRTTSRLFISKAGVHVAHAPLAHGAAEVRRWFREIALPNCCSFLAVAGGPVVGFVSFTVREVSGWIEQLYVSPGRTGVGVGSALLQVALQSLPDVVQLFTFQASFDARRFDERPGFRAIRFRDGAGNEERCPDVLYRLQNLQPESLGGNLASSS